MKMTKIKLRILVLTFSFLIMAVAGAAVVHAEQEKRQYKYTAEKNYYTDLYNAWALYKSQYSKQIAEIKNENKKNMDSAKDNYEKLLAQQPGLIAQHTKTVQNGTYTQSSNQTIGNVTSTSKSTQTVKVTKPKSQPKTKTS